MKYFYSSIITGFLIPFLPLGAQTALAEASHVESVEQGEEASLTSLDEELSLLDGEFEEFKEELFSLENDLQRQGNSLSTLPDSFLYVEKSQAEAVFSSNDQVTAGAEVFPIEKRDLLLEPAVEPMNETVQIAVVEKPGILKMAADESKYVSEQAKPLADSDFFPDIEIAEPVQKLAVDPTKLSVNEKSGAERETAVESTRLTEPVYPIIADASPLPAAVDKGGLQTPLLEEEFATNEPGILNVQGTSLIGEFMPLIDDAIAVDLKQAFDGSPIIYTLLFAMSVFAVGVWLYSIFSLRFSARVSRALVRNLENKLSSNHFDEALSMCEERNNLLCKMISRGIHSRRHGLPVMIEAMKAEGKRASISFWQKIGLLNDIAIMAPMLGLLGTVLGMFYAFYDVNRSIESISVLFDGLGISVGTTVAGLIVAILALILHSTAKYRLIKALALIENEAQSVATLIDDRTSIYKGS
jgi:biopolymer transport protein ExbB